MKQVQEKGQLVDLILEHFPEISPLEPGGGEDYRIKVPKEILREVADYLSNKLGLVLSTMTVNDERQIQGCFKLYYVFSIDWEQAFLALVVEIEPEEASYPSITPVVHGAHWYEREGMDLFGIRPEGHPEPNRLVLHRNWPLGVRPMRKDFDPAELEIKQQEEAEHRFQEVEGDGSFYIPVGPIHAGIIEPGHFRFGAAGETIINLEARLFYTHRGMEKQAEGLDLEEGVLLAERICGACSFSHAMAYCQAIEMMAGVEVSTRVRYLRTLLLEMERLYNHIGDVGNICAGTGFAFGSSNGARIKETLMKLNRSLTGNRFLRGIAAVGGLRKDLTAEVLQELGRELERIKKDFQEVVQVLDHDESLLDRFQGTGQLGLEVVKDLGVVGPAARASGWQRDSRVIHPYGAYDEIDFSVPVETTGDVWARYKLRVGETWQCFRIIMALLEQMPEKGSARVKIPALKPYSTGLGWSESARGENIHWLMAGEGNTIYRYRVRSASYCNWPAVPTAVEGNIVPDFPLINKSFELCYACLDR